MFENLRQSCMRYERCFGDKKLKKPAKRNSCNRKDSQFSFLNRHLQEGRISYQQKKQKGKIKSIKQRRNFIQHSPIHIHLQ